MEHQTVIPYTQQIKAIKSAILQSRYRAAAHANAEMLSLYYGIGEYISRNSRKGFWGTNAIETIAAQLQQELPGLRGFSARNIRNMRFFYEEWSMFAENWQPAAAKIQTADNQENTNWQPITAEITSINNSDIATFEYELQNDDFQIVVNRPLTAGDLTAEELQCFLNVGFTHHIEIITKEKNISGRLFYIERCATEFWSKEKLRYNLKSDLYHKQGAITNNFNKTIANIDFRKAALNAFKDEYLLDWINLEDPDDEPDERVLEQEIVLNIRKFIMALGKDFSFMGNQYRLEVDGKERFVDLLFFNRRIQSLVAIELKKGEFKPEYAGKLNFYLSALDDMVRLPHENPSIGIILCKNQGQKTVEYAFRDISKPMGVANYLLANELPDEYKDILPNAETLKQLL
jgi:predicted nuclease of restriction endonuclease-like (RecB) superfamily